MPSDEKQIIRKVLRGDMDAFAGVIRKYQRVVWRIASLALRDTASTEDLVQQVFVAVYQNLDRYDPKRDLGPWLRTIARNQVRKELRRSMREERRLRAYHRMLVDEWRDETALDREDATREALQQCKKKLSAPARKALDHRYVLDRSYESIAKGLGRTVAAYKQWFSRIRASLRKCLEAKGVRA